MPANRIKLAETGVPDRVPIYGQIHEYAMALSGYSTKEFYTKGKVLVQVVLETAEKVGLDDPHICYDTYNIEAEALGMKVKFFDDGVPELSNEPLIRKKSDLKKLKPPEPGQGGRMPFVLEVLEEFQRVTNNPAKLHPSMSYTAPFTLAARLRGVENFLVDLIKDRSFAHELLSFVTEEVLIPWIKLMKSVNKWNEPIVGGADALASPPNTSIELMKEYVLPYILKLRDHCGNEAVVQNWWGESYVESEQLLKLKQVASPRIIMGQDPDVDRIGPEVYKDYAEKHGTPLILGIGADFLMTATPEEVRQRVRRYVNVGKRGGKFLLYLCNVGSKTPRPNVDAAVEATREYGNRF